MCVFFECFFAFSHCALYRGGGGGIFPWLRTVPFPGAVPGGCRGCSGGVSLHAQQKEGAPNSK